MPTDPNEPITQNEPVETPPKPDAKKPDQPDMGIDAIEGQTSEQQIAHWKKESRKFEDRAREKAPWIQELKDKAKRFDELEESQKTEAQKLTDRAEKAEARANEIEVRATRAEVAAAKGVPVNLVTGSTKEEMESNADALLVFRGDKAKPDFGAGDRGQPITEGAAQWTQSDLDKATREKRYDDITKADDAGLFNKLRGITKA